jgi:hypothetical protein
MLSWSIAAASIVQGESVITPRTYCQLQFSSGAVLLLLGVVEDVALSPTMPDPVEIVC